ncbi:MAG: DUF539 domain-containing protein [Alphaproteobacteria bacterium]|nr:DUF539 domain-containing protein [Alphaproteobacteria bacterium]
MSTILATTAIMGAIMAIMAVGVMMGGSPLKGSCGGKGGPECVCDAFEQAKCKRKKEARKAFGLG